MSLDLSSPESSKTRGFARPQRAPSQQETRSSSTSDAMVHWLPTSAVIAAMAAAFDAAEQKAHAALNSQIDESDVLGAALQADRAAALSGGNQSPQAAEENVSGHPGAAGAGEGVVQDGAGQAPETFFSEDGPTALGALAVLLAGADPNALVLDVALNEGQIIRGTDGDDILVGGAGDVLLGGAGDDTLIAISELIGEVSGGAGFDQLLFETSNGVTGNFASSELERIVGSEQDDSISVEGSSESIELNGRAGDDVLTGGSGNDILTGGAGRDSLFGLDGDDTFYFETTDIFVDGGAGIDTIIFLDDGDINFDLAASNIEIAFGGAGNDVFIAGGLDVVSTVFGGGGDDVVTGGLGFDTAVYIGNRDRYEINTQEDGLVIVSDTLGFEGIDTLSSIEQLRFADQDFLV